MTKKIEKGCKVALIPARGGSKGVPGKNIRKLGGYPLIAYSIAAGELCRNIQRIVVSTDSEEIADVAKFYGAEVPFLRPVELAMDNSGDIGFVKHALSWFAEMENSVPEFLVHLRPTTPLRDTIKMDNAISLFAKSKNTTSLRSAHKAPESPFKWFVKNNEGYFQSVDSNLSNDDANGARQTFQEVFIPDGYIDILKSNFVLEYEMLYGSRMMAYESPVCTEIDTQEDFDYLEYQIKQKQSDLYDYIKHNKRGM